MADQRHEVEVDLPSHCPILFFSEVFDLADFCNDCDADVVGVRFATHV